MWLIGLVIVVLLITVIPVMIAARIVGARRTGFWISLLALFVSALIVGFAVRVFHGGGVLAVFASALGFMLILDTTYLRGLAIVFLQYLIAILIGLVLMFTAVGSMFHMKDMMRNTPLDTAPSQSV
jgi:hypothetical protein